MFLAENKQGSTPPSYFSSYTVYKYSFCGLFSVMFVSSLVFLLVILLFALAAKHSAEGLASVPTCKKAVMRLTGESSY